MLAAPENYYQGLTSPSKLRGQYYTPDDLVALMLDRLRLSERDVIVDPACGDGRFLCGAVAALARQRPHPRARCFGSEVAQRLIGYDSDPEAVAAARSQVSAALREHLGVHVPEASLRIHQADLLREPERCFPALDGEWAGESLAAASSARRVILGNPPYVEAKRLPRDLKEELKRCYPDAVAGAPDLYQYFLHLCLGWLRECSEDVLAFVLPNKLLVNASARPLRERLLRERRLKALWFATRARIFPEAAVYPIVLFAGGRSPDPAGPVETAEVAREEAGRLSLGPITLADPFLYEGTAARALFPLPHVPALRHALEHLLALRSQFGGLGEALDIRWTVSFHRAGLRERYVVPQQPHRCALRFLGGGAFSGNGEVVRYRLNWAGWWIRYEEAELRRLGNPLPDPAIFAGPKIVICQNGRTLRAAYDEAGFVLKDTFLCGLPRPGRHPLGRHPRALVGLLCSRAIHFFYSHVFYGGHVNGGYLHFLRSFLIDLPLGVWTDAAAREVAERVRQRETAEARADWEALEEEIERRVSAALRLTPAQHNAIAAWAEEDPNWRARERTRPPRGR